MPNDKEKIIREMHKKMMDISTELTRRGLRIEELQDEMITLARESIQRDKELAKLEAEVIAMRDAMPQWIRVEDRLPPTDCKYAVGTSKEKLVVIHPKGVKEAGISVGWYSQKSKGWFCDGFPDEVKVSHWMPLPEAPTGGEQIPYIAIGNGEPVPPQLKPIIEKLNDTSK